MNSSHDWCTEHPETTSNSKPILSILHPDATLGKSQTKTGKPSVCGLLSTVVIGQAGRHVTGHKTLTHLVYAASRIKASTLRCGLRVMQGDGWLSSEMDGSLKIDFENKRHATYRSKSLLTMARRKKSEQSLQRWEKPFKRRISKSNVRN